MIYLDFEKPIEELDEQIEKLKQTAGKSKVDMTSAVVQMEKKLSEVKNNIYANLTPWQRVQLSRHPERPYTLYYIEKMASNFLELHGDRHVADDKAMVGGIAELEEGMPVMFIGQQKGANTKMRQYRNFGMPNPEGYRKALRLMKLAEKFNIPVVCLIDTPGAYPGLEAEERGQGEAIARNLYEMMILRVPIISVIIGEGASGGALGIGIGDKVLMLENTWYSVISPESCSSILFRGWEQKELAAEQLHLTANDMLKFGLIDGIIKEPKGGAHNDAETMAETLKKVLIENITALKALTTDKLVEKRIAKFSEMGVYETL